MNRAGVFLFFLILALIAAWYHMPIGMCVSVGIALLALTMVYRQMELDQSDAVAALTGTPEDEQEEDGMEVQFEFFWPPWVRKPSTWSRKWGRR